MPQVPDTINALTDRLVARLGDDELFRYVVHHVTYTYETSDIMGMDAVFVHGPDLLLPEARRQEQGLVDDR